MAKILKEFFVMVKNQFHKIIKTVRTNNGTKFTCLKPYFLEQGTLHHTTIVGTPQQNERVECKHRRILNVAHALCFQRNLPK